MILVAAAGALYILLAYFICFFVLLSIMILPKTIKKKRSNKKIENLAKYTIEKTPE